VKPLSLKFSTPWLYVFVSKAIALGGSYAGLVGIRTFWVMRFFASEKLCISGVLANSVRVRIFLRLGLTLVSETVAATC